MSNHESALQILDDAISDGVRLGIGQRVAEDERLDGRHIRLGGRDLLNFASCSYLGLEMHASLRQGVIDAVERFHTQFSSSRVYVSAPQYAELEMLLENLFDGHVIATASTSLGHLAAIPALVSPVDAVILDHQVHHSVQIAAKQVAASGTHVEIVRHNDVAQLEDRIAQLAPKHRHVWYMADGVYSMFGDFARFHDIEALLERHEQLRLYMDDAHGMSWMGKHGRGVALNHMALHPHMVLATSLNKAFAAAGGVLIFPDPETKRRVRNCGGPLLFSGPIQPPMLGACVASARLHVSPEIEKLQVALANRIGFCERLLSKSGLPVLSDPGSPIKFVGVGNTSIAQHMTCKLMDDGFYPSVAQFPAVSLKRGGVRFAVTLHHREQDIEALIASLCRNFERVLAASGSSRADVERVFGLSNDTNGPPEFSRDRTATVRLEVSRSIDEVAATDWDEQLAERGAFDRAALRSLERCFHDDQSAANAWRFLYFRAVDPEGVSRLSTFFTETLWKADMLSSDRVSRAVEQRRLDDPDFLVTKALTMGSLLTDGNPLYIAEDSDSPRTDLLSLLVDAVESQAHERNVDLIAFRDLPQDDAEMDGFFKDRDYVKVHGPSRMVVDVTWDDEQSFLATLTRRARRHQRQSVLPWNDFYRVEILRRGDPPLSQDDVDHLHGLYLQVKRRSFDINTFDLPKDLIPNLLAEPGWEIAVYRLADGPSIPVAFTATFVTPDKTVPTLLGLDYRWVEGHGLYRQCLRHSLLRAQEIGCKRVYFGFGAELEKQRFGARAHPTALYLQLRDQYPLDVLAEIERSTRS